MEALHAALGGLLIHIWKIQKRHPELLSERSGEIKTRHIRRSLEAVFALDDRPLNIARNEMTRLIVDLPPLRGTAMRGPAPERDTGAQPLGVRHLS